ncbi:MAG: protein-(glutamine-N5) methyltransferase, release factor-specific [Chloroflexi bacterium 13_1_20CM_50_12]|nr:MAG: protein-(glutamine-N5) methyltransferase, release factor-specific [Chloroflexi bacterium 13_1_20CM_50_12]
MTTILEALELGTSALAAAGQPVPRLDAQVLLGHVLHVDRVTLIAYPENPLTPEQERHYGQLLERRKRGEPVAYLVGHKEFFGLDFFVDQRVLIPRPETEQLVEAALKIIRVALAAGMKPVVADIGTGSGIIPITIAVQEPRLPYLYASDVSPDALEVARINCRRHSVEERVRLLSSDLLTDLPEPSDILTANLPYVGTDEMELLTPEVRAYEPQLALFSGNQGLDLLQRFFTEARHSGKLKEHAVLLLEIGYQQREKLIHLLSNLWPLASVSFEKDYAGWDRLLKVVL